LVEAVSKQWTGWQQASSSTENNQQVARCRLLQESPLFLARPQTPLR
jgi:hypothetical protein